MHISEAIQYRSLDREGWIGLTSRYKFCAQNSLDVTKRKQTVSSSDLERFISKKMYREHIYDVKHLK